eukprot:GFYU01015757.1.p1 GENE.GFYU01015757.1~~GFYU01015757.1.p1  ORF type:complete len:799 (+),score=159.78 GFYU01015757.1:384-2780(+)
MSFLNYTGDNKFTSIPTATSASGGDGNDDGGSFQLPSSVAKIFGNPFQVKEKPMKYVPLRLVEPPNKKTKKKRAKWSKQPELYRIMKYHRERGELEEGDGEDDVGPQSCFDGPKRWLMKPRDISLYWTEKVWILFHAVQIYGLLLHMSDTWPWPRVHLDRHYWMTVFNCDIVGFYTISPTVNRTDLTPKDINEYIGCFILLPWFMAMSYWICNQLLKKKFAKLRHHLRLSNILTFLGILFYLPITLALSWAVKCDKDGFMDILPLEKCFHTHHILLTTVVVCTGVLFLFGFPLTLVAYISPNIVHRRSALHEEHMRTKEMEYLLGLDADWRINHYSLFSSFRRRFVYMKVAVMMLKLLLGCLVVFLRDYKLYQIGGVVVCFFFFLLYCVFHMPYRHSSSNIVFIAVMWSVLTNAGFGYMKAAEINNAILVDSNLVACLQWINVTALVVVAMAFVAGVIGHIHDFFPDFNLFGCLGDANPVTSWMIGVWDSFWDSFIEYGWNVNSCYIDRVTKGHLNYVAAIRSGKHFLEHNVTISPEFVKLDELEDIIDEVHDCWADAKLLEHQLETKLHDILVDLVALVRIVEPRSFLPNDHLEEHLGPFRRRLDQRELDLILVPPRNRSLLLKLLAVRAFIGDRRFPKTKVWLQPSFAQPLRQASLERVTEKHAEAKSYNEQRRSMLERGGSSESLTVQAIPAPSRTGSFNLKGADSVREGPSLDSPKLIDGSASPRRGSTPRRMSATISFETESMAIGYRPPQRPSVNVPEGEEDAVLGGEGAGAEATDSKDGGSLERDDLISFS